MDIYSGYVHIRWPRPCLHPTEHGHILRTHPQDHGHVPIDKLDISGHTRWTCPVLLGHVHPLVDITPVDPVDMSTYSGHTSWTYPRVLGRVHIIMDMSIGLGTYQLDISTSIGTCPYHYGYVQWPWDIPAGHIHVHWDMSISLWT